MAKILLFGAGLQVLSVAWSLKDRHQVEACAEDISVIRRCRSLTRCFKVCLETLPLSTFDGYDLIIPVEEVYAEWLSLHRGSLGAKAAVMDWETFSLASDKTRLMALCEERGFPHPKTRDLEKYSPAEAAAYQRSLSEVSRKIAGLLAYRTSQFCNCSLAASFSAGVKKYGVKSALSAA